jgi:hypothetical protein
MKKLILTCATFLFLFSCTQEPEFLETAETPVAKGGGSAASSLMRAGDGSYDVIGAGYNITGDYANANSAGFQVINIPKFKAEQDARFIIEFPYSQTYNEEYGDNAKTYALETTRNLDGSTSFLGFGGSMNFSNTTTYKYDSRYVFGSNNLTIKHKRYRFNATNDLLKQYVTPEFLADLNTKTPAEIVRDYGTHVCTDIFTGAKFEVLFQSETNNANRTNAAKSLVKANFLGFFGVTVENNSTSSDDTKNFNKRMFYQTRGGDPTKGLTGEVFLDNTNPTRLSFAAWQSSSTPENAVLVDFGNGGLRLIYEFISDPAKKAAIKSYVDNYLNERNVSLIYANTRNIQNGDFVLNNLTGTVYFMFEGKLRGIESPNTLTGLFNYNASTLKKLAQSEVASLERGVNLGPDNNLPRTPNGTIYLREGNFVRPIMNYAAFQKYKFNSNAVVNIPNLNGYTVDAGIY